jgi:uncharacterized membrane protein
MQSHALLALAQGWTDSIGLLFTWVVLLPVVATICVIVMIVAGRGEKAEDAKNVGRWGRKSPDDV